MKATKIYPKSEILFRILLLACVLFAVAGCDTLKEDPDVITPETSFTGDEVYVTGNGTSIIDLSARIQTNLPVTLSVTAQPTKGSLTSLGKGLLQYAPTQGKQSSTDKFEFTLFSSNNEVVSRDTVIIIVEPDTTQLPCGVFAVDDRLFNLPEDSVATIDVLANDFICGADSADLEVSIFGDGALGPFHGTATVVDNRVVYTPNNTFAGNDKFIYKIRSRRTNTVSSYAQVTISKKTFGCEFTLLDDAIAFDVDTLRADTVGVPVFVNDQLCGLGINKYATSISTQPRYSTAKLTPYGIRLSPADIPTDTVVMDSLRYNVCRNDTCREATLLIKMIRN